ncbi:plasmid replication initiator TrfA [Pseudomonas mohnii]
MNDPKPVTKGGMMAVLAARTAEAQTRAEEEGKPAAPTKPRPKVQLPLWPELERAIPNHLARSSLFSPCGVRRQHDRTEVASRQDVKIMYTGEQLDMADSDVFMQALTEARGTPLGEKIFINRGNFLRSMGRSTGTSDYVWLHESFRRLFIGTIEIEAKRFKIGDPSTPSGKIPKSSGLHLLSGFDYDDEQEAYFLSFDARIIGLFYNKEFALVDWQKRLEIRKRRDMAKWLQNYVASHEKGVHRIGLKYLKEWMTYTSPPNKFKAALGEALGELQRVEIIQEARIELSTRNEPQAHWIKP